jgi:uncharacterized protein YggE
MKTSNFMSAVALALAVMAAAGPVKADDGKPRTISINATGTVDAEPDMATITIGVVTEAEKAGKAIADNAAAMSRVVDAIKKVGIDPKDIATERFSVSPIHARNKSASGGYSDRIEGFRVRNSATITVRDIKRVGDLIDLAAENGANTFDDIDFIVSDMETKLDDARRAAMANAIRRAKLYVEAAGARLGDVKSISEHVNGGPRRFRSREASAMAASTPIEPGQQTLSVSVSVVWELDD